jgi:hypothetical protein|tara:strand:+ start:1351 stop:1767 length:417 start_codon:yes stop_codon:yes gene_type:complete
MIKFLLKIYKESGIGSTHVITRTGNPMLKRWGVWTPLFTVLISKIYPIKQIAHNHEGSFISFLLWGKYQETVFDPDKSSIQINDKKWFNQLSHNKFHTIKAEQPVYTIMFMGRRMNEETSGLIKNKIIPASRLVRGYR